MGQALEVVFLPRHCTVVPGQNTVSPQPPQQVDRRQAQVPSSAIKCRQVPSSAISTAVLASHAIGEPDPFAQM